MKSVLLFLFSFHSLWLFAQKSDSVMTRSQLVGVWQRDTKRVGNGLEQSFHFFDNGNFIINLGNESDDARGIIALKGRYRLVQNKLYVTITSRTIVEAGKIAIADPGVSNNIFYIKEGHIKEINESNPQELADPIEVTKVGPGHIELGSETYFRISKATLSKIGE